MGRTMGTRMLPIGREQQAASTLQYTTTSTQYNKQLVQQATRFKQLVHYHCKLSLSSLVELTDHHINKSTLHPVGRRLLHILINITNNYSPVEQLLLRITWLPASVTASEASKSIWYLGKQFQFFLARALYDLVLFECRFTAENFLNFTQLNATTDTLNCDKTIHIFCLQVLV